MRNSDTNILSFGLLNNKVARRIFFLFVLCAIIPMTLMAYTSYRHSTKQLNRQAYGRLINETKSIGMAIIERLLLLETDLKMISEDRLGHSQANHQPYLQQLDDRFNGRLKRRFANLTILNSAMQPVDTLGTAKKIPKLGSSQEQHLMSGKTVLFQENREMGVNGLFLLRSSLTMKGERRRIIGEINPLYLWGVMEFISPSTGFLILDSKTKLLATSFTNDENLNDIFGLMNKNVADRHFDWHIDGVEHLASFWTIFMQPQFSTNWRIVLTQSKSQILAPLNAFVWSFQLVFGLSILVVLIISLRQIRNSLGPLNLLRDATKRIASRDFSQPVVIDTKDEFQALGEAFNDMSSKLNQHFVIMSQINRIGAALSLEKDNRHLLEIIVEGAKSITNADAGGVYLLTDGNRLKPSIMGFNSIQFATSRNEDMTIPLYDPPGTPNTSMVAAYSVNNDAIVNIPDVYEDGELDFYGDRELDQRVGYRSQSFLSIPMKNHDDEIIGVLQLINAKDKRTDKIIPFSKEDQNIIDSIASQAAVALTKTMLINDFKKLFDSLVQLIATAIDEKSRHTGEHCRRVPQLAMLLAKTVDEATEGIYKKIRFSSDELYELKTAALLHDCGKVATPTHIMDKATKLETLFDRVHLIETRFEIVVRDFNIKLLEELLNEQAGSGRAIYHDNHNKMHRFKECCADDILFIKNCNTGDSPMTKEMIARLDRITKKYNYTNRKGEKTPILTNDERYNLNTLLGTITESERHILNQHVVATSKMLESLSYPKSLRNVPLFAASHHERMDGKGYPKGLRGEDIPLQTRIIAIADIFESLTAKNRPYKKGKTVGEALQIMKRMKEIGQIDAQLFDLFLKEKVYLDYTRLN